ncbi:MAG: type III PLP-dependent enzyme [Pseudomonadales bacterium]
MHCEAAQRPVVCAADAQAETYYRELVSAHGSPLLVFDAAQLKAQYRALQQALPGVALFFAIKAHPDPAIIDVIDRLGGGFDVASAGEMDLLLAHKISGRRAIHTHPIKKDREIRDALRFGATTFVVDNAHELEKLTAYRARIGVLLRVSFRSKSAQVDLSRKFGCEVDEVASLCHTANQLGIHIKGLSFHVGSQCGDAEQHVAAIKTCRELMLAINSEGLAPLSTLDIGGGFPADYLQQGIDIEKFCAPIRGALDTLPADWHVIAEPGRFLIAPAVTSVCTVTGKSLRGGMPWYYLDDGVYGSYSGQLFDHTLYPLRVFREGKTAPSIVAGPTCDSIDVIAESALLPELAIGDLLIGNCMGAYTAATKTRFNLVPEAKLVTVNDSDSDSQD